MGNSVYSINKGINQTIEFKGLKAQYIWYVGGGVIVLMVFFAILYVAGLPSLLCIGIVAIAGSLMVIKIYRLSHKYGEHGMMKAIAKRQLPKAIKSYSRDIYFAKKPWIKL